MVKKRQLIRLSHPDADPVLCRVILSPALLESFHSPEDIASHVMTKACKFFDVSASGEIKLVDARELSDDDDATTNC